MLADLKVPKSKLIQNTERIPNVKFKTKPTDAKPSAILPNISSTLLRNSSRILHNILWYNVPNWIHLDKLNKLWGRCSYSNCQHTTNRSLIKESSAVVFCTTMPGLSGDPPLQPSARPRNQIWVLFGLESPVIQKLQYGSYTPTWHNSVNWSMSYRRDDDITMPYGYLEARTESVKRNYSQIYKQKTDMAAWIVSRCASASRREEFVEKLRKHGLDVDIFGRCGTPLKDDPHGLIVNKYKFYFSFENSLCSDYITEKFFKYYNQDTILVVRGGADYENILPKGTYINTASFKNISDLVSHLEHIGSNETLYTDLLRRKDQYKSIGNIKDTHLPYCRLCDKINSMETNKKTYESVPTYLETCFLPKDID